MDDHPLIRFVDGPSGRRARMATGRGDVWEIIATVKANNNDIAETAEYLGMETWIIEAAVAYYGAFPQEIEEFIVGNERAAAEGYAAWLAAQAVLTS